jgi:hypothetical protein
MKTANATKFRVLAIVSALAMMASGCASADGASTTSDDSALDANRMPFGPGSHNPHMGHNVVIVGIDPDAVDLSDPALPPGLTHESIRQGLVQAQAEIAAAGYHADLCMILPDDTAEATVHACFAPPNFYDTVVVGAGIRLPPKNLILFENVMNVIHQDARRAVIAFNVNPEDSAAAALRVIAKYYQ